MTGTELAFIVDLNHSFLVYSDKCSHVIKIGDRSQKGIKEYQLIIVSVMVEMVEYWFRDTVTGDDNFCLSADIQPCIDMLNNLMGSSCYIDTSIYP
jgi:hypothetical protein